MARGNHIAQGMTWGQCSLIREPEKGINCSRTWEETGGLCRVTMNSRASCRLVVEEECLLVSVSLSQNGNTVVVTYLDSIRIEANTSASLGNRAVINYSIPCSLYHSCYKALSRVGLKTVSFFFSQCHSPMFPSPPTALRIMLLQTLTS